MEHAQCREPDHELDDEDIHFEYGNGPRADATPLLPHTTVRPLVASDSGCSLAFGSRTRSSPSAFQGTTGQLKVGCEGGCTVPVSHSSHACLTLDCSRSNQHKITATF